MSSGTRVALRNLRSFILPLTAAGLVPWSLLPREGWRPALGPVEPWWAALGALLFGAGLAMLVWTVSLFVRVGRGTLAPWDPTSQLVAVGPYARVRNPMIGGVLAMITGEALALGSARVGAWAVFFFLVNHVYFLLSEEPGLVRRFGAPYQAYRRHVPRWIPRATPWRPGATLDDSALR
jgi:protein-S-isoprenylcysteine O-methyltransferase Ste14